MPLDHQAYEKQMCFIQIIKQKPTLGKHVRELHWTVMDTSSKYWRWSSADEYNTGVNWDDDEARYDPEDGTFTPPPLVRKASSNNMSEPIWRTFRSITNISSVDICWLRY